MIRMFPRLSQDAAITLGLAGTSILHARDEHDAAERWVRVLRLYGMVGTAMQALGVGEAPLETPADEPAERHKPDQVPGAEDVTERSRYMALQRGAPAVGTIDVLFACFDLYGSAFDRALYVRGTSREELLERLAYEVERVPRA
jgi:hypothetical protein